MLVFLLIFFGELLVYNSCISSPTFYIELRKFTVYGEISPYRHDTNEENFTSTQFLFYQAFIGNDVVFTEVAHSLIQQKWLAAPIVLLARVLSCFPQVNPTSSSPDFIFEILVRLDKDSSCQWNNVLRMFL